MGSPVKPYDRRALEEIDRFKNPERGWLSRKLDGVTEPISDAAGMRRSGDTSWGWRAAA